MMRKFYLFFLTCTCLMFFQHGYSYSQAIVTIGNSHDDLWIGKSVYYLADTADNLSIENVMSDKYRQSFTLSDQTAINFGNQETTFWLRFTLTNQSGNSLLLSELNYDVNTLNLYYRDTSGNLITVCSGSSVPITSRKYITNVYAFDLPVRMGDTATFYLKCKSFKAEYPLMVATYPSFIKDRYYNNLLKGIYFGIVFLFIIYNLILFLTLRDKNYLNYIFYIFFTSLLMAEHAGINALLWGNRLHAISGYGPTITCLGITFFILFSKSFLEVNKRMPRARYVTDYVLLPGMLLIFLLDIANKKLAASILNQSLGLFTLLFMSIVAIILYRKGHKPARFYILACSFYFAGVIIFIMKSFAIIPYTTFTTNSLELGSAIELMMFSVSMADRMKLLAREKATAETELLNSVRENERLVRQQNKLLEIKVDERTTELRLSLEELTVSRQELENKNHVITEEIERSEALLLNILPYETAKELKEKGKADAKLHNEVSILFTDFVNFTQISENMEPHELVTTLDTCFTGFDEIIGRHNVEKIKTIGDSYMAVAGLHSSSGTHALSAVGAALEIMDFMKKHNDERANNGKQPFEIRIGIHSGPVVSGIVGSRKFAYDVWGDSVNMASRMESTGEPGRINISDTTFGYIREKYNCEYRGKIEVKNKGLSDMYFVLSAK